MDQRTRRVSPSFSFVEAQGAIQAGPAVVVQVQVVGVREVVHPQVARVVQVVLLDLRSRRLAFQVSCIIRYYYSLKLDSVNLPFWFEFAARSILGFHCEQEAKFAIFINQIIAQSVNLALTVAMRVFLLATCQLLLATFALLWPGLC